MENKINIAKLLKDCPVGMELDCTMYEDVYFDYVDELNIIHCYVQHENYKTSITFNQHGTPNSDIKSKCVIFPKSKTTWEGFARPFEDGDIVTCTNEHCTYIAIFKEMKDDNSFYRHAITYDDEFRCVSNDWSDFNETCRFATEYEKQKLFDAIKANGYKWNAETKTLEKLPKFKVGYRIIHKTNPGRGNEVTEIKDTHYILDYEFALPFLYQDQYELISNKFDIANLKPFDKVLVRQNVHGIWGIDFFGFYNYNEGYYYTTGNCVYAQCIPYEQNKHLLGKTDDCDGFYKTWE